jgi:glycine cleavage system H lipoate-binding protein
MKQFNQKNQIWFEQNDGVVTVGFTKSFLDGLDQCWHVLPANNQRFREKAPLMVVETNDALISIMSPVSANFVQWERKAQDFPDQLTEDDVILTMTTARVAAQPRVEAVNPMGDLQWGAPQVALNVNQAPPRVAVNVRQGGAHADLMRRIQQEQEVARRAVQGEF